MVRPQCHRVHPVPLPGRFCSSQRKAWTHGHMVSRYEPRHPPLAFTGKWSGSPPVCLPNGPRTAAQLTNLWQHGHAVDVNAFLSQDSSCGESNRRQLLRIICIAWPGIRSLDGLPVSTKMRCKTMAHDEPPPYSLDYMNDMYVYVFICIHAIYNTSFTYT